MVGKMQTFTFHHFTRKFRKTSGESYKSEETSPRQRRSVPLFASPLDPKATAWLRKKRETGNLTLKRRPTIAQFEADRYAGGIFRKQYEATTLELFFDLFFVANLAVFTDNHEHFSPGSVGNYIGFFAILWFTWFHTSIFDVRFYVDSLFNRFCKMITFGLFTAFTGLGPVYDSIMYGDPTRAYHALALVLMVSRFILLLQHGTVLWFVRPFRKTIIPLSLVMLVYFLSAMAFLGTYLDKPNVSIDSRKGHSHVIVWYAIITVEAIVVIIISSIWRILSFKYTHLVERVGLLSLIVMGEGIIGLTKTVSYLLAGTNISVWSIIGKVVAAVMLIYEIYLLYFSPIDHDRFGTIRQQFWTLLHFPLHVAFLLTGEGSAATLLWDAVMRGRFWLKDTLPDMTTPSIGYNSTAEWVLSVNDTMTETAFRYHYATLKKVYDWYPDLDRVRNITDPFGSTAWNEQAAVVLDDMLAKTTNFLFENFNFDMSKYTQQEPVPQKKVAMFYAAFKTIYTFFFAASGAILLLLACMYMIGKRGKSRGEYGAIIARVVAGIGLPCSIIAVYVDPIDTGIAYTESGWVIAIVTFAFLLIVIIDNNIHSWVDRKLNNYDESEQNSVHFQEGPTHSKSARRHGHGHRYGPLRAGSADAQAAALHFGKPTSFSHGHHHHHHRGRSSGPHRGYSQDHGRIAEDEENNRGRRSGESTPFVTRDENDFPLPPSYSNMTMASGATTTVSNSDSIGRQIPPSLTRLNTTYVPYHVPNPTYNSNHNRSRSDSYENPTTMHDIEMGTSLGMDMNMNDNVHVADDEDDPDSDLYVRRVQLYEPTMESPVVTANPNRNSMMRRSYLNEA